MKQPEWQRGGICGALSSTSQQLNLEPSEQRERERNSKNYVSKLKSERSFNGMFGLIDIRNMQQC